jgi:hypothetical protein
LHPQKAISTWTEETASTLCHPRHFPETSRPTVEKMLQESFAETQQSLWLLVGCKKWMLLMNDQLSPFHQRCFIKDVSCQSTDNVV